MISLAYFWSHPLDVPAVFYSSVNWKMCLCRAFTLKQIGVRNVNACYLIVSVFKGRWLCKVSDDSETMVLKTMVFCSKSTSVSKTKNSGATSLLLWSLKMVFHMSTILFSQTTLVVRVEDGVHTVR